MGASGWDYRVGYVRSLRKTLRITQRQILAEGDYLWPWESIDPQ